MFIDQSFLTLLHEWYFKNKRKLPWRQKFDPYEIWISEMMLQQTQVKTMVPYFNKFMDRFPNLSVLAHASLDEVLTLWSGLGYYSRARNIHNTAKILNRRPFPRSRIELEALPGIGPYTAGAILLKSCVKINN